jgi:serine/threonine protein kinase
MELITDLVKEKRLGKGGQGDVYQVVNTKTQETYALKEFLILTPLEAGEAFQEAAVSRTKRRRRMKREQRGRRILGVWVENREK